jgi:hypothetical protein
MVSDPAGAEQRGLFALLRALTGSGLDLVRNTAQMAASEARIVIERIVLRLCLLIVAAFVAATGLLLVLVGVAIVLARETGIDPWLAFVGVGALTAAVGAALIARALARLSARDLAFPATLAELETDIVMLRDPRPAADGAT